MGGSVTDYKALTVEELEAIIRDAREELSLRQAVLNAEEAMQKIVQEQAMNEASAEVAKAIVINQFHRVRDRNLEEGERPEWIQPQGAHDVYPKDYIVSYGGKNWISLVENNVWIPGESGWREYIEVEPEEPPAPTEWVQPTGAHDAYSQGDRVFHNGKIWISTAANNVWEPGVYGWSEE